MGDNTSLDKTIDTASVDLNPIDNQRLAKLCGQFDENLKLIEKHLGVVIHNRGNQFRISGSPFSVRKASKILHQLYEKTLGKEEIDSSKIYLMVQDAIHHRHGQADAEQHQEATQKEMDKLNLLTKFGVLSPRGSNQAKYIRNILNYDINFSTGPAGTGKTFLAVACAVDALLKEKVHRIILVRPVVEAGERLGFLPGDLAQKIDPYLRPLFDALYDLLGPEKVARLIEKNVIELAPLAYMRGRTLSDAFVILDEAQNTTQEQMKMFLTRLGFGSVAVITGDLTQIDLPRPQDSGLIQAIQILRHIPNISFSTFEPKDIVRHPLVQDIVKAYNAIDKPTA
jgi:phosphate starvation-inducible PhoH-like protein